jgi:hypothetical protein
MYSISRQLLACNHTQDIADKIFNTNSTHPILQSEFVGAGIVARQKAILLPAISGSGVRSRHNWVDCIMDA